MIRKKAPCYAAPSYMYYSTYSPNVWTNDSFKEKTYHTIGIRLELHSCPQNLVTDTFFNIALGALATRTLGKSNSGHRHLRSFRHSPLQSRTTDRSPPWASVLSTAAHYSTMSRIRFLLLVTMLLSLFHSLYAQQDNIEDYQDVDLATCFDALRAADADGDGKLNAEEHVQFLQDFGPTEYWIQLKERPLELEAMFYSVACMCIQRGGRRHVLSRG